MLSHLMKRIGRSSISLIGGLVLIGFAFVYACGQIPEAPVAESAVGITAPDGYSIACASGFTRITPHYCVFENSQANVSLTITGSCQSVDTTAAPGTGFGLPANIKAIEAIVDVRIYGGNVAGQLDNITLLFYTGAACTNPQNMYVRVQATEFTAIANTEMFSVTGRAYIRLNNSLIRYFGTHVGGSNRQVYLTLLGYYD